MFNFLEKIKSTINSSNSNLTIQNKNLESETQSEKIFYTKIVGVTNKNNDGTNRQNLIRSCKSGDKLKLVLEPDNKFDKNAVKVCTLDNKQLGYISKDLRIYQTMKKSKLNVEIANITGENKSNSNLGCNIKISIIGAGSC